MKCIVNFARSLFGNIIYRPAGDRLKFVGPQLQKSNLYPLLILHH